MKRTVPQIMEAVARRKAMLLVLLPLAIAGCKEEAAETPPLRPVLTATARAVHAKRFGPFASAIEARYQTQLGFQLAGRMVARDVFVGDSVAKGQRLAALDPKVIQFALLRARADVANAQAQLTNAEGIEARQRALAQGGNASQATLDNAVAGRDTAKARLQQAQAALRMAQDQIGYTELRANFDAVVTAWTAEVGQYVDSGQAVVTLARPDVREAVVDIPDDLVSQVAPGMVFSVQLQAAPSIVAQGAVREIGPLADEITRSHRVRLTLTDPSPAFRLGTTVNVYRDVEVPPHIAIPTSAVRVKPDGSFVWLLAADGKHVARRAVSLMGTEGADAEVTSGLQAGDKVVAVGVHSLTDGQAVAGDVGGSGGPDLKAGASRL